MVETMPLPSAPPQGPREEPPEEGEVREEAEVVDQTQSDLDALKKIMDAMIEAKGAPVEEQIFEDAVKAFEQSNLEKEQKIALIQTEIDTVGVTEDVKKMLLELKNRVEGKGKKGWFGKIWEKTPGWAKTSLMWASGIALFNWIVDYFKGRKMPMMARIKSIGKSALMITGISYVFSKLTGKKKSGPQPTPTQVEEEPPKVEQMEEIALETEEPEEEPKEEESKPDDEDIKSMIVEDAKPTEPAFKPKVEGERLRITKGNEVYKVNIGEKGIDLSQFLINPAPSGKDLTATVAFDSARRNRNMYAKLYEQFKVAAAEKGRKKYDWVIDRWEGDKSASEGARLSLAINDFLVKNPNLGTIRIKNIADSLKAVEEGKDLSLSVEFDVNQEHKVEMGKILELAKAYKDAINKLDPADRKESHKKTVEALDEMLPLLKSVHQQGKYANNNVSCTLEPIKA